MVCIYGIDVTCDTMKKGGENKESGEEEEEEEEEEVEEEESKLVVDHIGTFTYVEFIDSLSPHDNTNDSKCILSAWDLLGKEKAVDSSLLNWVTVGCIDASQYDSNVIEEARLEEQRKNRQRFSSSKHIPMLHRWMPSPEQIPVEKRPRLPLLAYEMGHVPRYTPIKAEAQSFACAMGLGCFAYDFFERNKKFVVCTWDSAWDIVRGDTYTIPPADKALIEENRGRHLYEGMMPEFPQKLILDLEYYTEDNPDISTVEAIDEMTLRALRFTSTVLNKMFNYEPALKDWIILEASSGAKASRHAILNSPWHFFRNMHDATYFRDVMKAFIEAGILFRDPDVMALMICAEPKRDKNGIIMAASSIAEQVLIEDQWYSCFIDWTIVNHTFRLMRTFRASKYVDDDRPFVEATMNLQRYEQERDLFINSLVSSVQPISELSSPKISEPGWKVTQETARETISLIRTALTEAGFPQGCTSPVGMLELNARKHSGGAKRNRNGALREGVSSANRSNSSFTRSSTWIKRELDSKDVRHYGIGYLVSLVKEELSTLIGDTDYWRVWAVWDTSDQYDSLETPRCFWLASANSTYCPIAGDDHSARGKMILQVNRWGKLKAFCQSGRCNGRVWELEHKKVSKKMLRVLWPKGFFKGGFAPVPEAEADRF